MKTSAQEAYRKVKNKYIEQIYRNPKNVGMSLGIGLDTNRKDPSVKGSYNGSHAFYIQELINNTDWENGSDQPQFYIRVLEGNGGGAVGFDLIDKIYTTALSDGSIILPVDASLIDLLHSDIDIYQFDSNRFSMAIDQVKHEAGVHEIEPPPDDALKPG